MNLKRVYLDGFLSESLISLLIREEFITHTMDGDRIKEDLVEAYKSRRLNFKSRLLTYLAIFDEINFDLDSGVDLSKVYELGLVEKPKFSKSKYQSIEDSIQSKFASNISSEHFFKNKELLLKWLFSDPVFKEYNPNLESIKRASFFFDRTLKDKLGITSDIYTGIPDWEICTYQDFQGYLHIIFERYKVGIEMSLNKSQIFASTIKLSSKVNISQMNNIVDDLYYMTKTNLNDSVLILPRPRNFREAIKFRNDPNVERFREVMELWLIALQKGDQIAENKIRKDLDKANKELKKLNSWQEFKSSPFNFWLNSIGGHIPILSNILTIIYMGDKFYQDRIQYKYNWINLVTG